MSEQTPCECPRPIVKVPVLIRHGGVPPKVTREGRGFSKGEVEAVGLTVKEARLLGVYVDERRKSVHEENIKALREWLEKLVKSEVELPRPKLPKVIRVKPDIHKVFKGKTMAGRRMRGLLAQKYRYTHNYKWKRKAKERALKKRHEAARYKGGH